MTTDIDALRAGKPSIDGVAFGWDFVPGRPSARLQLKTWLRRFAGMRPAPLYRALIEIRPHPVWMMYFIYLPDGQLNDGHRFTLARLSEMDMPLLVVCASPSVDTVPQRLHEASDALYWKGLPGYDFSAYSLGLHAIARASPGATVCVMNDSVFGPFSDLRPFIERMRWDLTGFTASSLYVPHIQSYAYIMRDVSPHRLAKLSAVLPTRFAFNKGVDAVHLQELRFASEAARHMSVGSYWHSPDSRKVADPTLVRPFELVAAGFPFIKRSLIGKHAKFQDAEAVRALLRRLGHSVGA